LLHGLGSCGDDWPLQLPALEPRYRVLTLDLPGHGASPLLRGWPSVGFMADEVARLLEALEEPPVHLVGLSLGGAVSLQLAVDHPDRVRSLTAVNAFARLRPHVGGLGRGLVRMALLAFGPMAAMGRWVADGLFPGADQSILRQAAAQRIAANPRRAYLQAIAAVSRFDLRRRLKDIACPTLIVAGERDATVPMRAKVELAEGIPGARLEVIPASGHATPLDAPEAFNNLLLRFLSEVDQAAQGSLT
jgi:3-oxoadipate enol-lactonase